jgi:hypothetical protein
MLEHSPAMCTLSVGERNCRAAAKRQRPLSHGCVRPRRDALSLASVTREAERVLAISHDEASVATPRFTAAAVLARVFRFLNAACSAGHDLSPGRRP